MRFIIFTLLLVWSCLINSGIVAYLRIPSILRKREALVGLNDLAEEGVRLFTAAVTTTAFPIIFFTLVNVSIQNQLNTEKDARKEQNIAIEKQINAQNNAIEKQIIAEKDARKEQINAEREARKVQDDIRGKELKASIDSIQAVLENFTSSNKNE